MSVDYDAKQYVGINLKWDYDKRDLYCSTICWCKTSTFAWGISETAKPDSKISIFWADLAYFFSIGFMVAIFGRRAEKK